MKKGVVWILIIIGVVVLSLYLYTTARAQQAASLPIPETAQGEVSAFMPETQNKGSKPAAKGTAALKATGAVTVLDEKSALDRKSFLG